MQVLRVYVQVQELCTCVRYSGLALSFPLMDLLDDLRVSDAKPPPTLFLKHQAERFRNISCFHCALTKCRIQADFELVIHRLSQDQISCSRQVDMPYQAVEALKPWVF